MKIGKVDVRIKKNGSNSKMQNFLGILFILEALILLALALWGFW